MLNTHVFLQNRYRIESLLGKGGMGAVYKAIDITFDAPVAIKENLETTTWSQKQFIQEAQLLHQLRHPNIPRVTDYFLIAHQGQYLVMDYIGGENLKEILARHKTMSEQQALACMIQVLDALIYLHSQDIIHRDVKPANVKLTPHGTIFLVDFGLAKTYDPSGQTTLGARAATPGFAPPEQYGHGRTDSRSDIYSVGATLYALLTGHILPDALDLVTGTGTFVEPRQVNANISEKLETAILKAMQIRPADRFQSAQAFRDVLAEVYQSLDIPNEASGAETKWPCLLSLAEEQLAQTPAKDQTAPSGTAKVESFISAISPASPPSAPRAEAPPASRMAYEPDMVKIPAGNFLMGSDPIKDAACRKDERPQHSLFLPEYYMSRTPITHAQYAIFVQHTGYRVPDRKTWQNDSPPPQKAQYPVAYVSFYDALAYCKWLAETTGKAYSLPTEAEWEKGARGSQGYVYPWGNTWRAKHCNTGESGKNHSTPVDAYPQGASPYGLLDMAGNVFEWTATLWGQPWQTPDFSYHYQAIGGPQNIKPFSYPYTAQDGRDNLEAGDQVPRVVRGGSFIHARHMARCAYRDWSLPFATFPTHGFRVVIHMKSRTYNHTKEI